MVKQAWWSCCDCCRSLGGGSLASCHGWRQHGYVLPAGRGTNKCQGHEAVHELCLQQANTHADPCEDTCKCMRADTCRRCRTARTLNVPPLARHCNVVVMCCAGPVCIWPPASDVLHFYAQARLDGCDGAPTQCLSYTTGTRDRPRLWCLSPYQL